MSLKRILVATDLSQRSQPAIRRAAHLAARSQAALSLVHVVDGDSPPEIVNAQSERARAWLADHVGEVEAPLSEVLVRTGDAHAEILAVADELDADLVVLGAHRRRLLLDAFIGTTAERLLRVSARPALVVHNEHIEPYGRVVAAIDLSETSAEALRVAERLGFLSGEASIVHVFHAPAKGKLQQAGVDARTHEEAERARVAEAVRRFLEAHELGAIRDRVVLREGGVTPEILDEVSEARPDLLILGTRGGAGVARAALGSVAEAVLRAVPCDVLAVPPREGN